MQRMESQKIAQQKVIGVTVFKNSENIAVMGSQQRGFEQRLDNLADDIRNP